MKSTTKKSLAALLILCLSLSLLTACAGESKASDAETSAEESAAMDDQSARELLEKIYDANRLEAVFGRRESIRFLFPNPDAPDGYDMVWETADAYYQSYADWFAIWEQDHIFYQMTRDRETDRFSMLAGYDYDGTYSNYSFVGELVGSFLDAEHVLLSSCHEEDGLLVLSMEYDESVARTAVEDQGLEYTGQTVRSRMTVDAKTFEILSMREFVIEDGEERELFSVEIAYDLPEPFACLTLRGAFERDDTKTIELTYVIDPDTDRETVRTMTVPANTNCFFLCDSVPFVYFYDREQTVVSGWDRMRDLTVYVFTDPDDALTERFQELLDADAQGGLVLKDADGNVLEDGATLSGRYYYKVYIEGVPEQTEAIQTAWARNVLNAEEHEEWAERSLYTDELGRYILIVPAVGDTYTQETMFARLDEDDAEPIRINFLYDRQTVKETEPPELINLEDPKVGQTDYVLQWKSVDGAEFYEVLWYTPSGESFYYSVDEPAFSLSEVEGALDESGEYLLYIFPYGDGMPFTYGAWTSEVTE